MFAERSLTLSLKYTRSSRTPPDNQLGPNRTQKLVFGVTVTVASLFGDADFGSLNTLSSTPAFVSDSVGSRNTGPRRMRTFSGGPPGDCAKAETPRPTISAAASVRSDVRRRGVISCTPTYRHVGHFATRRSTRSDRSFR